MVSSISPIHDRLTFTLNGKPIHVKAVSPTTTLLEFLRQQGYVGTKEGCGDGDCGACTVVMMARNSADQPHYQAVNSCLIPLAAVADRDVITVEGIAEEEVTHTALHPVQLAMIHTGGSQCGYCTPGFIMSLFAAYYDRRLDDRSVEGNLCRCTGYLPIRRAADQLADQLRDSLSDGSTHSDRFGERLHQVELDSTLLALPKLVYYGSGQHFYRPTQLFEVFELLQRHSQATLMAGATDLGLEISHHRQHYEILISLEAVAELQQLQITPDWVEIGAALPLSQIEERLRGVFPSLDEMLIWFAARQVRNRATIGGNLGTASPIGDLAPVLLSLDAEVQLAGQFHQRWLPLTDFFKGYRQTDLQPGEVIVSVKLPRTLSSPALRRLSQSYKVGKRGTDDISIVAAAFTIDLDAHHRIVHARLGYGGVAATPIRAFAIENQLLGQPWTIETIQQIKPALRETFTPLSDLRGSASYRKLLIANLFEKFFVETSPTEPSSMSYASKGH